MGRLIRISIYALIILILYFWITTVIKSYQKETTLTPEKEIISEIRETDTTAVDTTAFIPDESDQLLRNEDIVDGKVNYKALDEKVDAFEKKETPKTITKTELPAKQKPSQDQKPAIKPKPPIKNTEVTNQNATTTSKGDSGPYLVMAGSYLLKENANKMVTKLKNMGYGQAEVIVFQSSQYHSVIAARYSTDSKAKAAAAELKRKGVDSFVKSI